MKSLLQPFSAVLLPLIFFCAQSTNAQIKGDPAFNGAIGTQSQKTSSNLSQDLKDLSSNWQKPRTKIAQSFTQPTKSTEYFSKFMQIKGDKVVVDVTAKDDIATAKAELKKAGATIISVYGRMISALAPIATLPQLEGSASIRYTRPAYRPLHAVKPVPMVISQGDTAQLSYLARKKGHIEGKGVKVGVLSDSYDNLHGAATGVAHGELPGPGNPQNFKTPVQVLSDLDSGGTDEGRAMMEIVHDVAPAASLAFHTANNGQADFANGILKLANAGCQVIADDVFYYAEPFFQDGIIAQAVDQAKQQGVAYFSAAGNNSIRSYTSDYRPTTISPFGPTAGTAHNFAAPGDPVRILQPIYIPPGGTMITSFQWDQSSFSASGVGAQTDFDIYLLNSMGEIMAVGGADNIAGGDPIEVFGFTNNTTDPTFYLAIVKYKGPDVSVLKYILYGDALFYLTNPAIPGILSPTLVGHTKADGAISTGAAFWLQTPAYGADTPVVESFSSVGGVPNYFDTHGNRIAPLIRKKPEIVAPDGGNTSFFDPFGNGDIPQDKDTFPNFFGTSAATPHAAGVAALMIDAQKKNTLTPSQIKGILSMNTWDMDDPNTPGFDKGFDFATGNGLIRATDAVDQVRFPNLYIKDLDLKPLCSPNPQLTRNWQINNPNHFDVPFTWQVDGTNQQGSLIAPPGKTTFSTTPSYIYGIPLPQLVLITWQDNFLFDHVDLSFSTTATCGKAVPSAANSDQNLTASGSTLLNGKPALTAVYPNPSDGMFKLYLSSEQQQDATITLYSADGRQLMTRQVAGATNSVDIDATGYKSGVYFLKVVQGNQVKTIKLVRK